MDYLFLIAIATIVGAWYVAKRDLTAAAAMRQSPAAQEIKELRETVEQLISVLEERAGEAEKRLQALIQRAEQIERVGSVRPAAEPFDNEPAPVAASEDMSASAAVTVGKPSPPDRYAPVYALVDEGIDNVAEIARRTGLGQAEVGLVLSLRPRSGANN